MSSADTTWTTRIGRGAVRVFFALLALGLVATPFVVAWYRHTLGMLISEQHSTPAAVLTPDQLATATAAGSGLPGRTPPVVLAYLDVRPIAPTEKHPDPTANPAHRFVVTPEAFEAQLAALAAAGYASITSDQYVDYLNGGEVPERSVLITFDDGTHGLWTYADKILERHGMHGVSFLITGNVGAKRPYYLSWQEINRMADSGRWDFQSHTRKMHARLPIDAEGTLASEMFHRRWLFEENRAEILGEFETKIREDLRGSVQDIVDHGLPRPTLFAFPFSEGGYGGLEGGDPQAAAIAAAVIREMFAGSFDNAPPQPLPAGARAAAAGMVARVELTLESTVDELLTKVRAHTPVTPAQAPPTARTDLWTTLYDSRELVRASDNEVRLLGSGLRQEVAYGPHATADWASYRGSVAMSGLSVDGMKNASLVARVGTDKEVFVRVSSRYMQLSVGRGSDAVLIGELPLAPGDRHTVAFTVSPTATDVVVDGSARLSAPADGGPGSYGGIGLASSRDVESAPWPLFTDLSITAGEESPNVRSGVGVPVPRLSPLWCGAGKFGAAGKYSVADWRHLTFFELQETNCVRNRGICRPPEIVRLQSSGRWDLGSHAHLGHVQIPIDDRVTGSLPHEASVSSRPAPDRHENEYIARITHDLVESTAQLVAHGLPEPAFPPTRCLPTPTIPKSHCGVNVSGGNARRREPQGNDQS